MATPNNPAPVAPVKRDELTPAQLESLRLAFAGLKAAPSERTFKIRSRLDQFSDDALARIANAKVRFLGKLAVNVLVRRQVDFTIHPGGSIILGGAR